MVRNTRISINVKTADAKKPRPAKPDRGEEPDSTPDTSASFIPVTSSPAESKDPAKDEQPKRP